MSTAAPCRPSLGGTTCACTRPCACRKVSCLVLPTSSSEQSLARISARPPCCDRVSGRLCGCSGRGAARPCSPTFTTSHSTLNTRSCVEGTARGHSNTLRRRGRSSSSLRGEPQPLHGHHGRGGPLDGKRAIIGNGTVAGVPGATMMPGNGSTATRAPPSS